MRSRALLLCACAIAVPGLASAADGDEWYLTPFVGGISPDYRYDVQTPQPAVALSFGREMGPVLNFEINANSGIGIPTAPPLGNGHLNLWGLSLDTLAVANRGGIIQPYIGLGLGAVRTDYRLSGNFDSGYDTHLAVETEVGVMLKMWESENKTSKVSLRPEIKFRWDNPGNTNQKDYLYMVGVQWAFGGSPVVAAAAPTPEPPPPPPAPPPPPPAPAPAPPPPPAQYVPKSAITLEGVNFAFNKADLTPDSKPVLDAVADGLKKHPRVKVEIQGHTDSVGTPAYNLKLSQRRAQSVLDYLLTDGVAADQLVAKGYGPTQPIASNKDAEGRAKNRRVVMYVLANPGDVDVKGQGSAQDTPPPPQ